MANSIFKKCTACGKKWIDKAIFLFDPTISLVGYQVSFDTALEAGFILFNHNCGTTLAVPVNKFQDLHQLPVYIENMTNEEINPEYCLHEDGEQDCQAGCECFHVKKIMNIIKLWPKKRCKS
ncbi:MAG: hypothetical protein KKC76_15200 [Proteobacteria bacterium]|nr:hypothetical protein [Pseudomonadota bacterium]MBU4297682.1 hypothetical protein [Pseudomonadota bacterium]MCG2746452.1 hypothetical protein [Desulfobulbaceae bacterium]